MPTNFDFLKTDPQFTALADTAAQAEMARLFLRNIPKNYCWKTAPIHE